MAKQKTTGGDSATSYGERVYGLAEQQHAASGTGNMIAMNTIRGGKRKTSKKSIFGKLKNITGRMRKYTMGLLRKTPKYSKSRKSRRR
jgi:K+-transporting ATPase A subunit